MTCRRSSSWLERIPCPRTRNAHSRWQRSFARTSCSRTGSLTTISCAQKAMAEYSGEQKVGWNSINNSMKDLVKKITDMKFELPRQSEEHYKRTFVALHDEVLTAF